MNFLAHIFLSGDNELIKIGNFMADGVRGKSYHEHLPDIQRGILLHRAIDTFTDAHPIFRKSTKRLHAKYHHYSGVIIDVFYDHFLAKNWERFASEELTDYIIAFYDTLHHHFELLTPRARQIYPIMRQQNWLLRYASIEGLRNILTQMDQRTGNKSNMRFAADDLMEWYTYFEYEFHLFFSELQVFSQAKLKALNSTTTL